MKKTKSKRKNNSRKRNSKKGKKKDLTGKSFEQRAKRAIQYLNPDKVAKHDVKLEAVYGGQRQFDVLLESHPDQAAPDFLYEAKDYGANVPFEKVEAFETKLKELKKPPYMGGGMISAKGFQRGPLKRAKFLGDKSNIKKYYQLKAVESNDWDGLINQFTLAGTINYPCVYDVAIIQEGAKSGEVIKKSIERQNSFLCNKEGEIVANLLDHINQDLKNNILHFLT